MYKTLKTSLLAIALAGGAAVGVGSLAGASAGDEPSTIAATSVVDETTSTDTADVGPVGLQTAADDETSEGCERGQRGIRNSEAVAEALGVTTDELQTAREAGQSLADIATAQGVPVDSVVDAIVDGIEAHLAEEVAEGDLTQAEADERLADVEERATEKVNATPGEGRPDGIRGPGGRGQASVAADA